MAHSRTDEINDARFMSVLSGCLDNLPTLNSRLVRIFISSTFTDTREERNVLLEEVYPQLKSHCKNKYGMDFQLVDMRWGVPLEAADDHQAAELCMQEIRNCQKLSTGPNFVTFINQKHGYRPLQTYIPEKEFISLCAGLKESDRDSSLIEKWYWKDENQVPPVYVLQPVSTHIPGYKDKSDPEAEEKWDKIFVQLHEDLRFASQMCHDKQLISEEDKHKYFMSVTEAEIYSGILELPDSASDHCLCFVRIIEDLTSHLDHKKACRFIDVMADKPDRLDVEAQSILCQLRDDKIVRKLNNLNITRNLVRWSNKDGINKEDHRQYLDNFKEAFSNSIISKIDKAVEKENTLITDDLYIEVLQHLSMATERNAMFYGRHEILKDMCDYLLDKKQDILVLYGQSGCGKTSIMAQTAKLVSSVVKNGKVILRFLGTSPDSSNLYRLLRSLSQQILICYGQDRKQVPEDFDELKNFFPYVLKFATAEKPLVIILDSLDQLSKEHNAYKLNWLPRKLPPHVRFLVSTYTEALHLIGTLRLVCKAGTFIVVPTFSQELSGQVVKAWLDNKNRTLTSHQMKIVEEAFKKCSLPLFVKLTFDQVSLWRSYMPVEQCVLTSTIQQSIERLFIQLEKKHGKVLVERALSYVTASSTGISETELEDLLSLDDTVLTDVYQRHIPPFRRIPPLLWVRIRHDISQYLVDKEVDEVRSFFWYHRQFYEAAGLRYLSDRAYKREIHSLMADYYLGIWFGVKKPFKYTPEQMKRLGISSPDGEADRRISEQPLTYKHDKSKKKTRYNKRKLNKLPFHLYEAARQDSLRSTCLYNLKWIATKIHGVSLSEVMSDYKMLGEKDGILHKTLKAAKSTLTKYPDTIAMEISGRLLSLLQTRTDHHEKKLLEETVKACARDCKLIPYLPCYNIPSESELYCIEHPKISIDPKISDISSDSSHFAVLTEDNSVIIWDSKVGEMETHVSLPAEEGQSMNILLKAPRKDVVIVATCHQTKANPVFIVNLNTGAIEHSLRLEKMYQKLLFFDSVKFDMTDSLLLYNVGKQAADVYDLKTGKLLHEFDGEPEEAMFVSEEALIVTHPKQTNIYNIYKSRETFEFVYQVSCIGTPKALHLDEFGTLGCVVMENSNLLQFLSFSKNDKDLGKTLRKIEAGNTSKILHIVLQTNLCLVTMLEGFLVYDTKSMKKLQHIAIPKQYKPHYNVLDFEAVLSPDRTNIIAGYDKHLIVWDIKTGNLVHSIEASKSRITKLLISPFGEYLVTKSSRNNHIRAWSIASLKMKASSYQPLALSNSVRYMCMNRAGTTAVLRSLNSNEFAVIDILQGVKRTEISHDFEAMAPFVTQDGKYAVIREYSSQTCLKVWDTFSGNLLSTLPVSDLHLKAYILGIQPDNMVVLTNEDNPSENTLTFYKLPSATESGIKITFGQYSMLQIFFVMDDKYILVGIEKQLYPGVDIFTKAYSVETRQEVRTFPRMHPQKIQMITPSSSSFLGHRIKTDADGKNSWELVVIDIETGEDVVRGSEMPTSVMYIGHMGQYGIDRDRNVFDIKKAQKCFQFDPDYPTKKTTPRPRLTSDEKYALWLDMQVGILKLGELCTKTIVGKVATHSIPMNLEVTPAGIVLMGCEDGRIMMLQIVDEMQDHIVGNTFTRSMKKAVKMKDSMLKSLKRENTSSSKPADKAAESKNNSKLCVIT